MANTSAPNDFGNTIVVRTLDDYAAHAGYDTLKFASSARAIEKVEPKSGGTHLTDCQVRVATSTKQLIEEVSAELDLRAVYLGAEAGVAAKLMSSFSYSETSFVIIARQTIERGNLNINETGKMQLSEEAREKLANDLSGFHRKFGGYYCHTVVLGGEIFVAYQCTASKRENVEKISGEIKGSYSDLGSLMAKASSLMEKTSAESRWVMTPQTRGAGGTLGDFDPANPESVRKAVMDFLRDFEKNVSADPKPYYGKYDAYWRFFGEADKLKGKVWQASEIVGKLCDWATDYADALGTINAFLDPNNREGYHVDDKNRTRLLDLQKEIGEVWRKLKDRYSPMELFADFVPPWEIEGVRDHPPEGYRNALEAMREQLLTQILHGRRVYMRFPASAWYVDKASMSVPSGEPERPNETWPYVRLSHSTAQPYHVLPVDKPEGAPLCHGDKVRIGQLEQKYQGQQLYMSDMGRAVRTASYYGPEHTKYEWIVSIAGCSDTSRVVKTSDSLKLTNVNWEQKWFMCPVSHDYLGVTDNNAEDWKMCFAHVA